LGEGPQAASGDRTYSDINYSRNHLKRTISFVIIQKVHDISFYCILQHTFGFLTGDFSRIYFMTEIYIYLDSQINHTLFNSEFRQFDFRTLFTIVNLIIHQISPSLVLDSTHGGILSLKAYQGTKIKKTLKKINFRLPTKLKAIL